jgi:peptide/nickel transport system substrate-binding protein
VILEGNYDAFQWDWYVEPDPDSILSDFTCGQRGGLSDSWYCTKAYDALYQQQNGEMDHAKRQEIVKRMQQMLFEDSPYLVTAYTTTGEAVRSDRFACFQPQPDPGGVWLVQYGAHNYSALRPVAQAGDCDGVKSALKPVAASTSDAASSGSNTTALVVGGIVLVVLVAGVALLAIRRRSTAEERE